MDMIPVLWSLFLVEETDHNLTKKLGNKIMSENDKFYE